MKINEKYSEIVFILALIIVAAFPKVGDFEINAPIALGLGVVFAWACTSVFTPFVKKTQKILLQASVVGLGFNMNLAKALETSGKGMLFTIVSVALVMVLGYLVGKALKVNKKTSYLVSAGTAICGGSAIAAVAPIVDADDDQMTVSLGTIFILNAVALVIFPPLGHYFGLGQEQFGTWAAIAIHDTSSVAGAGAAYGNEAFEVATMVKCTRALWIIPLAFASMFIWRKPSSPNGSAVPGGAKVTIPWFIFLFVLAMIINTYCGLPKELTSAFVVTAKRGIALTLFLIGTALSPKALKACGIKPLIEGVILWAVIGVLSLLVVAR